MFNKTPKYHVIDHHSMWGWPKTDTPVEDAEVVFVWNDFTIKEDVLRWQKEGKKVICFEHIAQHPFCWVYSSWYFSSVIPNFDFKV